MKKLIIPALLILAILLTACSGQSNANATASTTTKTQQSQPTPTPTPVPPKTAADIVQALKGKGMPIGESFTYNEDNDLNHILGRPGQYTGKVNFKDTRVVRQYVNNTGAKIEVADGGSIEVFDNTTDAKNRFQFAQTLAKSGGGMFAEWDYLEGTTLLRVSAELTKSKAQAYDDALKQILA